MSVAWLESAAVAFEPRRDTVFEDMDFVPNPGPQTQFLSLPDANIDVLFGGAVGGSKTYSLLMYSLRACVRYPGLQAFWFRKSFPELEHSVLRQLARLGYAHAIGCKWRVNEYELRFPNGSVLAFCHAKNMQEVTAYLSAEIGLLVIDERTTIPPDVVDMLYTRVRSGTPGVPCLGIRSATNPGEVGHARVLSDYIEATGHGKREITDENNRRRIFIQSRLADTPQLGTEYAKNLAGLPEKLRKAYLEGDWTVFAGQAFTEWRYARHVVDPFNIPAEWRKYNGIDGGYRAPWCVIWGAEDPDGRLWVYREIYKAEVGETEQAKMILAAEAEGEHVAVRYCDDSMFAVTGESKASAVIYAENGVHLTPAGKGPGSRVTRVRRTRTYLADAPACKMHRDQGQATCPLMHVFPACENLIRTLPTLPHAKIGDPEDVDTKAEDHAYDGLSYMLINLGSGPQFPILPEDEPGLLDGITVMNQVGQIAFAPPSPDDPWRMAAEDGDEDDDESEGRGKTQAGFS